MPDVTREDLAALVAHLERDHYPYNEAGKAAERAFKALRLTLEEGGPLAIVTAGAEAVDPFPHKHQVNAYDGAVKCWRCNVVEHGEEAVALWEATPPELRRVIDGGEPQRAAALTYSREEFERDQHGETGERNARARKARAAANLQG